MHPLLIIGQGLAGTAMAWRLWERGVPFMLVDRDEPVTSSKIAAGLLTPITGMRITLSENYGPWLSEAVPFYRHKERLLNRRFLHARPAVRLFKDDQEPKKWARRATDPGVQTFVRQRQREPLVDPDLFSAPHGGFQMKHAGYLDTTAYLSASRDFFARQGCWQRANFNLEDLGTTPGEVQWQGGTFSEVIFCTGWEAMKNPWFGWVPFAPARGTILTASAELPNERRIVNCGAWLVAREDGTLRIGSTYETKFDHPHDANPAKLAALQAQIRSFVKVPVTIMDQQTAVRPAITRQRTLIGRHPAKPRVAFFNGLGSKGTLLSPHFARRLVEHLLDGTAIPAAMDVAVKL